MNKLNSFQIVKIYFSYAPYILIEGFFIGSIIILIRCLPRIESLCGFVLALIAGYFMYKKIIKVRTAIKVIRLGNYTNATLTTIADSLIEHNGRSVKKYSFTYFYNDKSYYYKLNSAYHRNLEKGQSFIVFYDPSNPALSFIPKLHSIDPKPFLNNNEKNKYHDSKNLGRTN